MTAMKVAIINENGQVVGKLTLPEEMSIEEYQKIMPDGKKVVEIPEDSNVGIFMQYKNKKFLETPKSIEFAEKRKIKPTQEQ